jgi:hypothetical protein
MSRILHNAENTAELTVGGLILSIAKAFRERGEYHYMILIIYA